MTFVLVVVVVFALAAGVIVRAVDERVVLVLIVLAEDSARGITKVTHPAHVTARRILTEYAEALRR